MSILLEQEVKFRLPSEDEGRRILTALRVSSSTGRRFEANILYDFPDSRLTKRGEAMRLRRVDDEAWMTWKGPQHGSGRIKRRRELESPVADADATAEIFLALGMVESFRYEKYRSTYRLDDGIVTLDETPIGTFMEIEASPEAITRTATTLGLDMAHAIATSYPRLYELHRLEFPEAPPFMVFGEPTSTAP